MPYALVPFVEIATPGERRASIWRPVGFDRAAHHFLVVRRADGQHRAVIWFDAPVIDPRVVTIAEDPSETLGLASRTALSVLSDRSTAIRTRQTALTALLKAPPPTWRNHPLRPGVDGYRIWLGPPASRLFYEEPLPPARHTKRFADLFTRANATLDGSALPNGASTATWVAPTGWTVAANLAHGALTGGFQYYDARVDTETDTDSQYVWLRVVSWGWGGTGDRLRFLLHVQSASDASNGYTFQSTESTTGTGVRALHLETANTDLGTDTTIPAPGVYRLLRDGSSIDAQVDGVSLFGGPFTDTSESTGAGFRYVSMSIQSEIIVTGSSVDVDDFAGGDFPLPRRFVLSSS